MLKCSFSTIKLIYSFKYQYIYISHVVQANDKNGNVLHRYTLVRLTKELFWQLLLQSVWLINSLIICEN